MSVPIFYSCQSVSYWIIAWMEGWGNNAFHKLLSQTVLAGSIRCAKQWALAPMTHADHPIADAKGVLPTYAAPDAISHWWQLVYWGSRPAGLGYYKCLWVAHTIYCKSFILTCLLLENFANLKGMQKFMSMHMLWTMPSAQNFLKVCLWRQGKCILDAFKLLIFHGNNK